MEHFKFQANQPDINYPFMKMSSAFIFLLHFLFLDNLIHFQVSSYSKMQYYHTMYISRKCNHQKLEFTYTNLLDQTYDDICQNYYCSPALSPHLEDVDRL